MSRKSMFYLGAAVCFLLVPFASMLQGVYSLTGELSFKPLEYYFEHAGDEIWLNYALWWLAAIALAAKAFLPDLVPDIALVGLFGLLALISGILTLLASIANADSILGGMMWRYMFESKFAAWVYILLQAIFGLFPCLAFAAVAVLILLRSSLGQLFFAPAAISAVGIFCNFLFSVTECFGLMRNMMRSNVSIIYLLLSGITVVAYLLVGMAIREEE